MVSPSTEISPETAAPAEAPADLPPPQARPRSRSLAHGLVDDLSGRIRSQVLRPGDKLPTESAIMQTYGVSRTVVREALSKLQAAGLVETRHGIGTFVLAARPGGIFRLDPADMGNSIDAIAVLELRISLETEAAGLASNRRGERDLADMRDALSAFAAAVAAGTDTVEPDFRFHLAIARATGNRYFADILDHLGATIIPRTRITATRIPREDQSNYLQRVNREHDEIFEAIARGDAESARAAMRVHLTNSRERLLRARAAAQAAQVAQQAAPDSSPGGN
ncbi:FadR/GntR family transcriptional regulator [Xylophilus sp. GOD-11R]|uniref:FadR/GntR family transcriptional regulator n=1 Tax=Xylophilus sp. GOD-11R TaxID=3089814 RepID=UPI00298C34D7|nr:FadR/GntR family transcriptional regulator [Xylophilus sp. GOD-11R]WPB58139.1 FadR/GntR family transcriptional regulator [Xylophilus sp. GOD-11R]